jgi:hypothetical protein
MLIYMKQLGTDTRKHQNRKNQALRMVKTRDNHNGPVMHKMVTIRSFVADCSTCPLYTIDKGKPNQKERGERDKMTERKMKKSTARVLHSISELCHGRHICRADYNCQFQCLIERRASGCTSQDTMAPNIRTDSGVSLQPCNWSRRYLSKTLGSLHMIGASGEIDAAL